MSASSLPPMTSTSEAQSSPSPLLAPNEVTRILRDSEATLGWRISDPCRFLTNVATRGLGDALNLEHDYID